MTLNPEQELALQELLAAMPGKQPPAQPAPTPGSPLDGLLETWLGITARDVQGKLDGILAGKDDLQARLRGWTETQPMDSAFGFIAAASIGFYAAERGVNPRIKTLIDAYYYIATCASVGYADIFAATQTGRAIAALVMIVGPALAARVLDRPVEAAPAPMAQ
jgi:hypothetical protein